MKLRLGRKQPFSLEEIEREAAAEIEKRVSLGKPPPEEWKGLAERAGADTPMPGRPTDFNPPAPPPVRKSELAPAPQPADEADQALEAPAAPRANAPVARAKAQTAKAPAAKAKPQAAKAKGTAKATKAAAKAPAARRTPR